MEIEHTAYLTFEEDYQRIKRLAESLCHGHGQLTADDIISDAYLGMMDEIGGYDFGIFKKHAIIAVKEHDRGKSKFCEYEHFNTNSADDYKICYKCKQALPRDYFGIMNVYRHGNYRINSYCKVCAVEHEKNWKTNNRERKREWSRKYRKFCSDNLTDQHIIRVLQHKIPYYLIKKNKELISLKREQLIMERKVKDVIKSILIRA